MRENLFISKELEAGIQQFKLNLDVLYPKEKQRGKFESNFSKFLKSDAANSKIFDYSGNTLTYLTECIIPIKHDQRPPILLVFGNPASHSVHSKMFFASQGSGREHRIWKVLRATDLLSFPSISASSSLSEINQLRKCGLYELSYCSPFRIGMAVYYTMPSTASHPPWAGVEGLRKLFGREALRKIGDYEKNRIAQIISEFVSPAGAVITFQKDAYQAIKSLESPNYTLVGAKAGQLIGNCQCNSGISLFCLPPTRQSSSYLGILRNFRDHILKVN